MLTRAGDHAWHRRITDHLAIAYDLADGYVTDERSHEDLLQIAALALVTAARRFDPDADGSFHAFAVTSVLGALRHHVRDTTGAVRAPRAVHDRRASVRRTRAELEGRRSRPVGDEDVAAALGLTTEEVHEVWISEQPPLPLTVTDALVGVASDATAGEEATAAARRGDVGEEPAFATIDDHDALRRAVDRLVPRDRDLLHRRFVGRRTQVQLAHDLGVSQVHVSRRLRAIVEDLHDQLGDP